MSHPAPTHQLDPLPWSPNIQKLYWYNYFTFFHLFSAVLIPFFTGWGGLSLTQTLLLQSWFTFWAFVLEVPTGVVADVFSRRASLIWGSVVASIGFFLYPLWSNLAWFMLAEFLLALGFALRSGATEALACDSVVEKDYSRVLTRLGSVSMFGIILGPLVGAILVNWIEPRWVMWAQGIPALLSLGLAWRLVEPPRQTNQDSETTRFWDTLLTGWRFFRHHPTLQWLALDMAVVAGVAKMMVWLNQARLDGLVPVTWFGWIMSSAVLMELVAMNAYAWLGTRWGNRHAIIFWSGLIPAIGLLLAAGSQHLVLILLGVYLSIGLGMSRKPFFAVIFNEKISSRQRATILSTIAMTSQLLLAGFYPVFGRLADWSVEGTFGILGGGLLLFVVYSGWRLRQVEV